MATCDKSKAFAISTVTITLLLPLLARLIPSFRIVRLMTASTVSEATLFVRQVSDLAESAENKRAISEPIVICLRLLAMDKSFPCFGIKVVLFFFHICGCPLVVKSKLYSLANKPGTYAR